MSCLGGDGGNDEGYFMAQKVMWELYVLKWVLAVVVPVGLILWLFV